MSQTKAQLVSPVGILTASGISVTGVVTASSFVGDVTGTSASFSGNVSIGGTLTYEDVTNIDSVGLITARSGIQVLAGGIDAVGVVTATSFVGNVTGNATGLSGTPNINVGFATISGADFSNILSESVNIVAGKLSDNSDINLDNGMVHYFTTVETTTSIPNIVSSIGINTTLSVGDTVAVTIGISTGSYAPRISIDGNLSGITTYWSGGSAPDTPGDSGKDIYSYQIIKTSSATYDVLANVSNFS